MCGCSGYQTKNDDKTFAEQALDCGCGCAGLKKSDVLKGKVSFQAALLFFLIANPVIFQLTNKLLGGWVADGGCPTAAGLILHTVVYGLLTFLIMKVTLPTPY